MLQRMVILTTSIAQAPSSIRGEIPSSEPPQYRRLAPVLQRRQRSFERRRTEHTQGWGAESKLATRSRFGFQRDSSKTGQKRADGPLRCDDRWKQCQRDRGCSWHSSSDRRFRFRRIDYAIRLRYQRVSPLWRPRAGQSTIVAP